MRDDDRTFLSGLCLLRDVHSKRASSWDRSGGNKDWLDLPAGETRALLEERGAGCVRHVYWTYIRAKEAERLATFRGLVLRAFWDGAERPSIEVPLGDFFGVTNGQVRPIRSLAFVTNPGFRDDPHSSWGFNGYLPMPFADGARIEVENQSDLDLGIWFHIDYQTHDDASTLSDATRLHAIWNRENPTEAVARPDDGSETKNLTGDENYVILDAHGDGQFVGYFLTVVNSERGWWGEGDDMVFIDGEGFPPSIHGTGTEEVFGGGACPADEYTSPYTGFHCIENRAGYRWWGTNGMYRFYLTDPVRFRQSIRVTLEHGHGNDKANDYSSVAFWYQRGGNGSLPPLPPLPERGVNFQQHGLNS